MRFLVVATLVALGGILAGGAGCGPTLGPRPDNARGDTNGRMFDFVSTKPDGAEWTVRIRGDTMWVAYAEGTKAEELGAVTLSAKESRRLWTMIADLELEDREEGEPDDEAGTVLLRLREPTDDGEHDLIATFVSRDTDDDAVIDLANFLIDLIGKYHKLEPAL